jgi:uncharacterized protein (TIGR03790 family)
MRPPAGILLAMLLVWPTASRALAASELGVLYRVGDGDSERAARAYQAARRVPQENVVGMDIPAIAVLPADSLTALRRSAIARLPGRVRALLLVWARPYAAGCMSITTAFAVGYRTEFCEPGCGRTELSPLFDADDLDSARRTGWRIAMMLPADGSSLAYQLITRGVRADGTHPRGTLYLVKTADAARNVRASGYVEIERLYGNAISVRELTEPPGFPILDALAYFTGAARVSEIGLVSFMPGAVADHLTSAGGVLEATNGQTTALQWLSAGATASYGTVSEPCNHTAKFPSPLIFIGHYLKGETLIEAYWKSVAMPGQGLFVGEPLAAPFANPGRNVHAAGAGGPPPGIAGAQWAS